MDFEDEDGEEEDTLGEYVGERNLSNERHGTGWAYLPNGDEYQGVYRRGLRHGRGLYVFKNGARYLGEWRCGLKGGIGKFYYPDGSTYDGQWKRDLRHGHGLYTYQNGDTYQGAWYKGERHGVGTYTFAEADCYFNGTWKNGQRMGPAEVVFDQHRLHCTWHGERPVGPAAYSYACKTMALGYMMNDANDETVDSSSTTVGPAMEPPLLWRVQNMLAYDYTKLPPEPMPLPVSDSEDDECNMSPEPSEMMDFPAMDDEEDEEEEEEQTTVGDTDVAEEEVEPRSNVV